MKTFTAYVEWDPETKLYVGIVPGIPGALNSVWKITMEETRSFLNLWVSSKLRLQYDPPADPYS
jgi:hypothetical protein